MQTKLPLSSTLVTGASAGIGYATAVLLAKEKVALILCARRLAKLRDLRKKCLALGAPRVDILAIDLSAQNTEKTVKAFLKKNSTLRVNRLINAAGLAKGTDLVQNSDVRDWDVMMSTNVMGLLKVTHAVLPQIIERKGHIVNLGSVAGRLVYEGGAVYCATKFAVRALSEGLRMDLKGTGVRVTNIEPGMVHTEFSLVRLGSRQKSDRVYEGMMPLSASDVAQSVLWCLTQPAHVNIQELVIYPTDQASVGQVVRGDKSIQKLLGPGR